MTSILFLQETPLMQSIQMQLSKKQKTFSDLFSAFLEFTLYIKHIENKMSLRAYIFQKLQTAEEVVRQMSKKSRFRSSFNKRDGKWSKTLLKFEGNHLYHNY